MASSWHFVGLASSFPNITSSEANRLSEKYACGGTTQPGCRVFNIPEEGPEALEADLDDQILASELKDQVLIFQYNGKFHATDHKCPHSSYPLSQSTPFDIEDFGVVLSAAIMCPKHDWSFDVFTGQSDRGAYRLKIWELELRPLQDGTDADKEVWVRRKQRIG